MLFRRIGLSLLAVAGATAFWATGSFAGSPQLHVDAATAPLLLHSTGALPQLANALPGASAHSRFGVRNSGSESGDLVLVLTSRGSLAARRELTVRLERAGRVIFQGPLSRLHPLHLGLLGAGRTRIYQVTVSLGRNATIQGARVALSARWQAVQGDPRSQ